VLVRRAGGVDAALGETFEGEGQRGEIVTLDEPRLLAWTWGQERYSFELQDAGEACVLNFTHVFDDSYGPAAQHAAGWESYFDRLEAHLGGGELSEVDAHAHIAELRERYAARFGQDPAAGRRMIATMAFRDLTLQDTDDGPALRLERRYRQPVDRVWQAITDPEELALWFPSDAPIEVTRSAPPHVLEGRGSVTRCASSCGPTATAACSSSRTPSRTVTAPRAPAPAGTAASRAATRCSPGRA